MSRSGQAGFFGLGPGFGGSGFDKVVGLGSGCAWAFCWAFVINNYKMRWSWHPDINFCLKEMVLTHYKAGTRTLLEMARARAFQNSNSNPSPEPAKALLQGRAFEGRVGLERRF
ncbi:hypothetical protein F5146DRAFT_1124807 [Armillaria mellea]|nr:hypothetical protein F5146DRAFT_1124807 [Armillaria mellea]